MRWWRRRRRDLSGVIHDRLQGASFVVDDYAFRRMLEINIACDDFARMMAGLPSGS